MSCSSTPHAQVIGDPIKQSKSPVIHGFWIEKIGLEADYQAEHVLPGDLAGYLARNAENPDWRGCNVTMPHKQAVIPHLGSLDPLAQSVGAVNTILRQPDGRLRGYNTDVAGFLEPLAQKLAQPHLFRMARILGTGGAARAVVTALSAQGMALVLAGRQKEKAQAMLAELAPKGEHHAVALSHFADPTDFEFDDRDGCCDLIVNTTPLGMRGQPALPFDFSHAPPGSIVYDIVTDPVETAFILEAREAGFHTIDGISMLIGQAAAAFELFFGVKPPRNNDAELRALLTL